MRIMRQEDNLAKDPCAILFDDTNRKIDWLVRNAWTRMTPYERDFCTNVYSIYGRRRSRRQHVMAWKLYKRYQPKEIDLTKLVEYVKSVATKRDLRINQSGEGTMK